MARKRLINRRTGRWEYVVTADVIMEAHGISRATLYRWQAQGMPVVKVGYWSWYPESRVRNWVAENYPQDETGGYYIK